MNSLKQTAELLRSKGWLVSVHRDQEWRYKAGHHFRVPVYRVGVNPPNGTVFDWKVCVFEFPWVAEDWLKEILSGVA